MHRWRRSGSPCPGEHQRPGGLCARAGRPPAEPWGADCLHPHLLQGTMCVSLPSLPLASLYPSPAFLGPHPNPTPTSLLHRIPGPGLWSLSPSQVLFVQGAPRSSPERFPIPRLLRAFFLCSLSTKQLTPSAPPLHLCPWIHSPTLRDVLRVLMEGESDDAAFLHPQTGPSPDHPGLGTPFLLKSVWGEGLLLEGGFRDEVNCGDQGEWYRRGEVGS